MIPLDIYSGMWSDDKKKSQLYEELRVKTFKAEGTASAVPITVGNREGMVGVREVVSSQMVILFGSSKEIFIFGISIF